MNTVSKHISIQINENQNTYVPRLSTSGFAIIKFSLLELLIWVLEKRHRQLPSGKISEIKSRFPKSQFIELRYDLAFEYCIVIYESRFMGKKSIFFFHE